MIKPFYLHVLAVIAVVTLSGCSIFKGDDADKEIEDNVVVSGLNIVDITTLESTQENIQYSANGNVRDGDATEGNQLPLYSSLQGAYKGRPLTHHIGDYVRMMTQDLVANMDEVSQRTPIGVTHFSLLDSDLQQTNLLAQQMAESFIHEIHQFRIPVIDFKATNYIRVTEEGDFILSRDYLELARDSNVDFVLTGTLAKHQGGYMVNARIIGMQSRAVVATAQQLVPFYVADAVIPSEDSKGDNWAGGVKLSTDKM
ncbi:hypothetical protein J3L16_05345 [Alteromonas sp. 5E99-2]|uniref:FlgO family outer membrane protein n=1 Tax=Alteromonas sp. 5E99-2 TaxID=2817683 RepID=UPI001A99C83D|nr:FlgO family outer membrane protein [Alteromonas sp. 5E99-2]MBO1255111.1 hypothetical protein [Alteromonas sp. 5E99-2]